MPLYAFDSRSTWQPPFREQSRERKHNSRLATGVSQHLSRRNASAYRLCIGAVTSQRHTFALTRRNQTLSSRVLLHCSSGQSPATYPFSQLSRLPSLIQPETKPYHPAEIGGGHRVHALAATMTTRPQSLSRSLYRILAPSQEVARVM